MKYIIITLLVILLLLFCFNLFVLDPPFLRKKSNFKRTKTIVVYYLSEDGNMFDKTILNAYHFPSIEIKDNKAANAMTISIQKTEDEKRHFLLISSTGTRIVDLKFRIYQNNTPITSMITVKKMNTPFRAVCFYIDTDIDIKIPQDIKSLYVSDIIYRLQECREKGQ